MSEQKGMDQKLKDELKDYIFHAVQATKQENSGLLGEIRTNVTVLETQYKNIMVTLGEIKTQTTKTNGSVTSLRLWRSLIVGGLTIIVLLVLPLITYIFNTKIQHVEARFNQLQR